MLFTLFLLIAYSIFEFYAQKKEHIMYVNLYNQSIFSTIESVEAFNKTGIKIKTNNQLLYFYTPEDLWLLRDNFTGDSIIKKSNSDTLIIKHKGEYAGIKFIEPYSPF